MRKVILFDMVSLDGYFEGPNRNIDWHHVDGEFNTFAIEQLHSAGGLVFGRVTYELMASYWPTPSALKDDSIVAEQMNTIPKIVFSRTMDKADWSNTRLVKGDAVEELTRLKEQPGKDLFVFGSAELASSLTRAGCIDEYRLMVNPVVLGKGTPLFRDIPEKVELKLLRTKTFTNGNVLLVYEPVRS